MAGLCLGCGVLFAREEENQPSGGCGLRFGRGLGVCVCVFVSKSWDPTLLDFKNKDSSGFHFCKQPYGLVLS